MEVIHDAGEPAGRKLAAIVMAGGKGSRMGTGDTHKSTFDIAGTPAIVRLLHSLRRTGIELAVVIVGAMGQQVMDTISRHVQGVAFVHQREQRGTGHAARMGLRFLKHAGFDGDVLIVPGDAHVEPRVIDRLITEHERRHAALSIAVKEKRHAPRAGRVVVDTNGNVLASIEHWDVRRAVLKDRLVHALSTGEGTATPSIETFETIAAIIKDTFGDERQARKIVPGLAGHVHDALATRDPVRHEQHLQAVRDALQAIPGTFTVAGQQLDGDAVERAAPLVNVSVYLCNFTVAHRHVERILSANAQNEEYLTDLIQLASEAGERVIAVPLVEPTDVMSFNTPDELVKIIEHVTSTEQGDAGPGHARGLRSIEDWTRAFRTREPWLVDKLCRIHGTSYPRLDARINQYIDALAGFTTRFPDDGSAIIARAPGRINLMGRHVDHRGGDVNMLAIDAEVVMVAAPRQDDLIVAYNENSVDHPPRVFSISEILASVPWEDWFDFISNEKINEMIRGSRGDWGNYLKAAALRFQVAVPHVSLRGVNVFVHGTIPQAAGLSSSSALVVAMLDCLSALNGVPLEPRAFIDLCGEGEWFVGTRGGSSDHAAIKASERGKITRIGFFPFTIKEHAPFPPGMDLLVINSTRKACKSGSVLKHFNSKVLAYEIGFTMLREAFPVHEGKLHHLRDVSSTRLGVDPGEIYTMLNTVPERLAIKDLGSHLHASEVHNLLERFTGFDPGDVLDIRPVLLYGISECHRSERALAWLNRGEIERFGDAMHASHDGDRVACFPDTSPAGVPVPWSCDCNDVFLDAARERGTPVETMTGGYGCSIPEIDFIVDCLDKLPGVLGAQLSGAGLGGCAMALVRSEHVDQVITSLVDAFTARWGTPPTILVAAPVDGAGLL